MTIFMRTQIKGKINWLMNGGEQKVFQLSFGTGASFIELRLKLVVVKKKI
jgi:hypothetical protein